MLIVISDYKLTYRYGSKMSEISIEYDFVGDGLIVIGNMATVSNDPYLVIWVKRIIERTLRNCGDTLLMYLIF